MIQLHDFFLIVDASLSPAVIIHDFSFVIDASHSSAVIISGDSALLAKVHTRCSEIHGRMQVNKQFVCKSLSTNFKIA